MCRDEVALVHNGIIENHAELRSAQTAAGHEFSSETDTEVVVNLVYDKMQLGLKLLDAVTATTKDLEGAYALGVVSVNEPERLIAARRGSPLVIGLGIGENFIASDVFALLPVTQRFIFLEDGDVADITRDSVTIYESSWQSCHSSGVDFGALARSRRKIRLSTFHAQGNFYPTPRGRRNP